MFAEEQYSDEERLVLDRYFTNSDKPVFALVNLPEIVKGALFARYSRTHKPLRRLFLDEFYRFHKVGLTGLAVSDALEDERSGGAANTMRRADSLYERVFWEYGDDSVAQLGGAHLACEQVSALMAKVIERGRLAAYLEQSTRYIEFDAKVATRGGGSRYRYVVPPEVTRAGMESRYVGFMDRLFDTYSELVSALKSFFIARFPNDGHQGADAYTRAIRAKACDTVRGLLPAATYSNVGVFATAQSYELMLMRMRANPLAEVRQYSDLILTELRKVIPGFLKRVDVEDRGAAWSRYFADTDARMVDLASALGIQSGMSDAEKTDDNVEVRLLSWESDAETQLATACMFAYSDLPESAISQSVSAMTDAERARIIKSYVGDRSNRRHRPGRGFERIDYRFEVLSDFGSFRDLQRHRMMTLEWQLLGTTHGYATPPEIDELGNEYAALWHSAMSEAAKLHDELESRMGRDVAQYVVPFAYRVRYVIQLNARQAMHMIELRTGESGHSDYRRICLQMRDLIRDVAGHRAVADAMEYVDASDYGLGRLSAERRNEQRGNDGHDAGM